MSARAIPKILSALAMAGSCLGAACSPDEGPPGGIGNSSSGSTCPPGSTLTYDGFATTFFTTYCTRCHGSDKSGADRNGAPTGYNWDQYESIAIHAKEIDTMAAGGPRQVNRTMPPEAPRPSDGERRQLGQWLACELDVGR